jgi:hypothetical protein
MPNLDGRLADSNQQISFQQEESTNSNRALRRYVRSEAAPPASYAPVSAGIRKRSTRTSTWSSSSGRRTKRHLTATAASSSNRQRAESEPVMKLFGEDWLQDPNCVGSSVAAMGEESEEDLSDWSSWGTQAIRRSETYLPRSILEPVDDNNDDYDLDEVGNAFPQNAYPVTPGLQGDGNRGWTASEAQLAQALRAQPLYDPRPIQARSPQNSYHVHPRAQGGENRGSTGSKERARIVQELRTQYPTSVDPSNASPDTEWNEWEWDEVLSRNDVSYH